MQELIESEAELLIVREIYKRPAITQRKLSRQLGMSLGKVNYLIQALIRKGFIKVENFKKSDNKLAYLYYLTPQGIEEKSRLAYLFLQRKTMEYEKLEREIRELKEEVSRSGYLADDL